MFNNDNIMFNNFKIEVDFEFFFPKISTTLSKTKQKDIEIEEYLDSQDENECFSENDVFF